MVAFISSLFQSKHRPPEAFIELTQRSEFRVNLTTFQDGEIVYEESETRINESTLRMPYQSSVITDRRVPVALGGLVFVAVVLILTFLT